MRAQPCVGMSPRNAALAMRIRNLCWLLDQVIADLDQLSDGRVGARLREARAPLQEAVGELVGEGV